MRSQKGFSVTNLKYIKRWYLFYYEQILIRQQAADELEMPVKFALIPLYHHVEIVTKCHSLQEAFFYINQVIDGNWSRGRLEDEIKGDLFARQGGAITNFE